MADVIAMHNCGDFLAYTVADVMSVYGGRCYTLCCGRLLPNLSKVADVNGTLYYSW